MPTDTQLSDLLSEFARTMVIDLPMQGILDHLVRGAVEILPVTAVGVTLVSKAPEGELTAGSNEWARVLERLQSESGEGPRTLTAHADHAVSVPDFRQDLRFRAFHSRAVAGGLVAAFAFPMRSGGELVGVMDLYRDTPGALGATAERTARILAEVTATYLVNARSRGQLQEASAEARERSLHDPLTQLPNRELLLAHLGHSLRRSRRSGNRTAVLFCDLDKFKGVNDEYGHRIGDELLVAIAGRLTKRLRPGDTLARLSGDEFVLVLEDVSESEGLVIADRIVTACADPFDLSCGELRTSASIGIAFDGRARQRPVELLERADLSMYVAKCEGGGRYCMIGQGEQFVIDKPGGRYGDLRSLMGLVHYRGDGRPTGEPEGESFDARPRRLVGRNLPSR